MKKNLKPYVYKLWEPETICLQAVEHLYMMNRVLFVERSGELRWLARLRTKGPEPKGNQVLIGPQSVGADPKPGDLPMSRLKLP